MESSIEIKRLYANIGKLITSSLELQEIMDRLMHEVNIFFKPHHWSFFRVDPNTDELFFNLSQGLDIAALKDFRLVQGEGIAGTAAKERRSLCVPDVSKDPRFSPKLDRLTGFRTGSVLAVPVVYLDAVYGVIELVRSEEDENPFTLDDKLVLETISDFAAIAFANATAFSLLIDLSEMDTLTGFYNQSKLEKYIAAMENTHHHQRKDDLTDNILVIFIDLNDFKAINDKHGHAVGDRVLREFSSRIRMAIRSEDKVFRIGGDEFLIILEAAQGADMTAVIERMESQFSSISPLQLHDELELHFSYGIKQGDASEIRKMIHEADMMMYRQKKESKLNQELM